MQASVENRAVNGKYCALNGLKHMRQFWSDFSRLRGVIIRRVH